MRAGFFAVLAWSLGFGQSVAHARDFKNCSEYQQRDIEFAEADAKVFIENALPLLRTYLGDPAKKKSTNYSKIRKIEKRMSCMKKKLDTGKFSYTCYEPSNSKCEELAAHARYIPLGFWRWNSSRIWYCPYAIGDVGIQIHEMSHTCGADDKFYNHDLPTGDPFTQPDWEKNADTFRYLYDRGIGALPF